MRKNRSKWLKITVEIRWDEKAGLRFTLPSYRRARSTDKKETGNEEVSTRAAAQSRNICQPHLTIGLDLGDRNIWYCVLDEAGQIQREQQVRTSGKALCEVFGAMGGVGSRWKSGA
jgi:hypothetical protein